MKDFYYVDSRTQAEREIDSGLTSIVTTTDTSIMEDHYNNGFKQGYENGYSDGRQHVHVELRKVISKYKNSYPRPAGIIEAMESILELK